MQSAGTLVAHWTSCRLRVSILSPCDACFPTRYRLGQRCISQASVFRRGWRLCDLVVNICTVIVKLFSKDLLRREAETQNGTRPRASKLKSFASCTYHLLDSPCRREIMSTKTPSRRPRVRSEVPLTPSLLSAFNTVSIDSPIKRATSTSIPLSDAFQRQASGGVIRKGGVESRIDVVTFDYVPPPKSTEVKRSRSTPAIVGPFALSSSSSRKVDCLRIALNATGLSPHATPPSRSLPPLSKCL